MGYYRTRTYLAGDWDGDSDLIQKILEWNKSRYWNLSFSDAHELTQARDSSLPCSIKKSLAERLDASKTFVLVVGNKTDSVTKGSCQYCQGYNSWTGGCTHGGYVDYRSFIEYECEKAARDGLKIVVIYNYASVDRSKCPAPVRYIGTHINGYYYQNGGAYWNYSGIKAAIES